MRRRRWTRTRTRRIAVARLHVRVLSAEGLPMTGLAECANPRVVCRVALGDAGEEVRAVGGEVSRLISFMILHAK